jgi:hypothetical protein
MPSLVFSRRCLKSSGLSTKSRALSPLVNERPTRPPERRSTIDHSSTTRSGWFSGITTLPARRLICVVCTASAAASTAGFGNGTPKPWKCRSGSHTASKPASSAKRTARSSAA